MKTVCPSCKKPVEAGWKVCPHCGTSLDPGKTEQA
jgi:RNA polymerase subunit RPABC4/transcription elongation factor Spt4